MNSKLRDSSSRSADLKLFIKDLSDKHGKKRPIVVRSWSTIHEVKGKISQLMQIPPSSQRLFFGPVMSAGGDLPNHRSLHDAGIYRSGETLLLDIKGMSLSDSIFHLKNKGVNDVCISSSLIDVAPKSLQRTVQQARRGFALGLKPDLVLDGSGGTYFLHDARKVRVAVFKPSDEEPYAENNPRGYVPSCPTSASTSGIFSLDGSEQEELSLRAGISPGEACLREVAAFLLDHGNFSGVPPTTLAEARHPAFNTNGARLKLSEGGAAMGNHSLVLHDSFTTTHQSPSTVQKKVGSCQMFVNSECSMDDLSPSMLSVEEVHKIAILDIRTMNADRNLANLLCKRHPDNSIELVPIDHGYCLRSVCDVAWFDWCWLDWPQLKQPLSQRSKDYILALNIEADARLLKERLNMRPEVLHCFRVSNMILQTGVKSGLSLYEIATMCCRNDGAGERPSRLEILSSMAIELATSAVENGRWHHSAASNALVDQLSPETSDGFELSSGSPHARASLVYGVIKSASSANFSRQILDSSNKSGPALAHSSGSDSSSDTGDIGAEQEDCEEWAKALLADVSIDNGAAMIQQRMRSGSEASSSSSDDDASRLSSSPAGFWHIRPGSTRENDLADHTWSPYQSPRQSIEVPLSALPTGFAPENLIPPLSLSRGSSSRVSFKMSARDEQRMPQTIDMPPLDLGPPKEESLATISRQTSIASIKRSHSCSAFSFKSRDSSTQSRMHAGAGRSLTIADEQARLYFLKFVDLLIVREMTAVIRQRSHD